MEPKLISQFQSTSNQVKGRSRLDIASAIVRLRYAPSFHFRSERSQSQFALQSCGRQPPFCAWLSEVRLSQGSWHLRYLAVSRSLSLVQQLWFDATIIKYGLTNHNLAGQRGRFQPSSAQGEIAKLKRRYLNAAYRRHSHPKRCATSFLGMTLPPYPTRDLIEKRIKQRFSLIIVILALKRSCIGKPDTDKREEGFA